MSIKTLSKKVLAIVLLVALLTPLLGGCTPAPSQAPSSAPSAPPASAPAKDDNKETTPPAQTGVNTEGFPIVNETLKLKIVTMQTPVQKDFNEMVILNNFEQKSNVDVDWTCIPQEFVAERRNIMMANSQDLPDVFFKMQFTAADVAKYAKQGLFIPLNDLIDQYAPNIKAAFEQWPDVKAGLTMPDGNIYSLSYILGAPAITTGTKLFFNSEALEQIGKPVPTTVVELEEVLTAFKDLDYNGNGVKDEVPMTSSEYVGLENILLGSFGLGTRGGRHEFVDVDPKTNELRFIPASDEYKQLLQLLNDWYKKGLIDQEIFTMDMPKLIAKGEEGRALSYGFVNHSIIGTQYGDKSVGMTQPFVGPNGDKLWRNASSALSGVGNFVITHTNPDPIATIRWADYWYSDEGVRDYFMGVEGETYYVDDKGEYHYTDFVMKNPDGILFEQVLGAYVPWAGGANPSIAGDKYFKGGEMQPISKACADKVYEYKADIIWPSFLWDEEDVDDMAAITTDLQTYIKENRALFVTGARSFDEWDSFVKGLDNMRLDRYMDIYKKAAARYGN